MSSHDCCLLFIVTVEHPVDTVCRSVCPGRLAGVNLKEVERSVRPRPEASTELQTALSRNYRGLLHTVSMVSLAITWAPWDTPGDSSNYCLYCM